VTPAEFWAERLGCAASDFARCGLTLLRHPEPRAVFALAAGDAIVVAAPESLHERLNAAREPAELVTRDALARVVPPDPAFVGPARIAYLERRVAAPADVVELPSAQALDALRAAVTAEEWRHANLEAAEPPH